MSVKTFLVANSVPMKTGHVEVLSRPNDEMPKIEGGNMSDVTIPNKKVVTSTRDNVSTERDLSLIELASKVADTNVVFPSTSIGIRDNHIDSTLPVKASQTTQQTSMIDYRPTIIMMTEFLPLFKENVSDNELTYKNSFQPNRRPYTAAGDYFDVQTHVRSMRTYDAKQLLNTLRSKYKSLQSIMTLRQSAFEAQLSELHDMSHYLWTTLSMINGLKLQLDMHNVLYKTSPAQVLHDHIETFDQTRTEQLLQYALTSIESRFPSTYDFTYCLSQFGYDEKNVQESFASTKIWLQTLYELKNALETHTFALTSNDNIQQRTDTNEVNLTFPTYEKIKYSTQISGLVAIDELKNTQKSNVTQTLSSIIDAYENLYGNLTFRQVNQKIASLVHLLSKEYRYSSGLSNLDVRRSLSTYYGYNVNTSGGGNLRLFDSIFGQFGNNALDVRQQSQTTLVGVSQVKVDDQTSVMTFEPTPVDLTVMHGGKYYVDQALDVETTYDTTRMSQLMSWLSNASRQFNVIVNGLNLLSSDYVDHYMTNATQFQKILDDPRALFRTFISTFAINDGSTLQKNVRSDIISSVLSMANDNVRIKSLLFMLVMMQMTRAYNIGNYATSEKKQDNTPVSDELIEMLITEILDQRDVSASIISAMKSPTSQSSITYSKLDVNSLKHALKSSTLLASISNMINSIMSTFQSNDAFSVNVTLFSNVQDTTIAMSIFDVITSLFGSLCDRSIVGTHGDKSVQYIVIGEKKNVDHMTLISEIDQRLAYEVSSTQCAIFCVINALDKLSKSLDSTINYLNSENSIGNLKKIISLFDDKTRIKLLLTEQQIRLFTSTVEDVMSIFQGSSGTLLSDNTGGSEFDVDNQLKLLDDSEISEKVKRAINTLFSSLNYVERTHSKYKIITVGLDANVIMKLMQESNLRFKQSRTQRDIVNVCVYKVDMKNPDIVFQPQKFMFELSRFIVRNDSFIKDYQTNSEFDVIEQFPTRDSTDVMSSGNVVQYLSPSIGERAAFDGIEYSFLTNEQKRELYKNHVLSYLLEVYTDVMTGNQTSEKCFDVQEPQTMNSKEFTSSLVNYCANYLNDVYSVTDDIMTENSHVFFSPIGAYNKNLGSNVVNGTNKTSPQNAHENSFGIVGLDSFSALRSNIQGSPITDRPITTQAALSNVSMRDSSVPVHMFAIINEYSRMLTPLSDANNFARRIIQPKQFDRIFNVLIDSNAFEIDVTKTESTVHGKQALELLVKSGDVTAVNEMTTSKSLIDDNVQRMMFRRQNTFEGDLLFDKYVITIEVVEGKVA